MSSGSEWSIPGHISLLALIALPRLEYTIPLIGKGLQTGPIDKLHKEGWRWELDGPQTQSLQMDMDVPLKALEEWQRGGLQQCLTHRWQ